MRRLYRLGTYLIILQGQYSLVGSYSKLLIKDTLQGLISSIVMSFKQLDETIHQPVQKGKTGIYLFLVTAIDELVSLLPRP
ncbi:MAG: hypothetical protein GX997_09520 [Bacteroidales bacterium]|nr:hypothetical protein [Bacteroidales bacterium]